MSVNVQEVLVHGDLGKNGILKSGVPFNVQLECVWHETSFSVTRQQLGRAFQSCQCHFCLASNSRLFSLFVCKYNGKKISKLTQPLKKWRKWQFRRFSHSVSRALYDSFHSDLCQTNAFYKVWENMWNRNRLKSIVYFSSQWFHEKIEEFGVNFGNSVSAAAAAQKLSNNFFGAKLQLFKMYISLKIGSFNTSKAR